MKAPINLSRARRRAVILATVVFAVALGLGRVTNVWLMVGLGALAALEMVPRPPGSERWPRPPGLRDVTVGVAWGAFMLGATHAVYPLAVDLLPALAPEARRLYDWLDDPPGPVWGAPVLALAVLAEEAIFRGVLVDEVGDRWSTAALLLGGSALYTLPQIATGTWLLPVVALVCGMFWMAQRLWTKGLTVPLFTHLTWSLGVFSAFPLEG